MDGGVGGRVAGGAMNAGRPVGPADGAAAGTPGADTGRVANGANGAAGADPPGRGLPNAGGAAGCAGVPDAAGRGGAENGARAGGAAAGRRGGGAGAAGGVGEGAAGGAATGEAGGEGTSCAPIAGVACRLFAPTAPGKSSGADLVGAAMGSDLVGAAGVACAAAGSGGVRDPGKAGSVRVVPAVAGVGENSCDAPGTGAMVITPPHTEHLARTDVEGIFAGSMRNTDRHSGQATFTTGLLPAPPEAIRRFVSRRRVGCLCGGRSSRPTLGASLRSSSFRLQVR